MSSVWNIIAAARHITGSIFTISGARKPLRLLALAGLCALLLSQSAFAGDALRPEDVMAQMRLVKSAKGNFVERKTLAMLSAPIETKGTLTYEAPDLLIKHTLQPAQEKLTVRGDLVTIVEGRAPLRSMRLTDSPQVTALVESIRATLSGDLATLERYYTVAVSGTPEDWALDLAPKTAELLAMVTSIQIKGAKGTVRSVDTLEHNGDRTIMTVFGDRP